MNRFANRMCTDAPQPEYRLAHLPTEYSLPCSTLTRIPPWIWYACIMNVGRLKSLSTKSIPISVCCLAPCALCIRWGSFRSCMPCSLPISSSGRLCAGLIAFDWHHKRFPANGRLFCRSRHSILRISSLGLGQDAARGVIRIIPVPKFCVARKKGQRMFAALLGS
jgi:hypothetical protein